MIPLTHLNGEPVVVNAELIALGGTIAAVILSFPGHALKGAGKGIKGAFLPAKQQLGDIISTLSAMAAKARREGLVALEKEADAVTDPFMRKGLRLAVDGMA